MPDQFVTIQSFTTEIEAEIVRGRLQSEGIDSFIVKDDCGGMYPQLRLTQGVLLKVHAADRDRAAKAIAPFDFFPDQPAAGEEDAAEETAAILSINAWIVGIIGLGAMVAGFISSKWFYAGMALFATGLALKFLSRKPDQ